MLLCCFLALASAPADEPKKDPPARTAARMVHYTGEVQGVGFRATAVAIAQDYPVTGWVKNLDDGRVQLLVEGPEDAVKKFLQAVRKRWEKNITKEEVEEKKPTGEYKDFSSKR
jgi:acylphosphatase